MPTSHSLTRRLEAIRLFREAVPGRHRIPAIARRLGVSYVSVSKWVRIYQAQGLSGLQRKPGSGRPPRLTATQWQELFDSLRAPQKPGEPTQRWTSKRIQALILERFGVRYKLNHIPQILRYHGWSSEKRTRRKIMPTMCLACLRQPLERPDVLNALSRYVKHYSICRDCGVREAFHGFFWKKRAESLKLPIHVR